MSGGDIADLSEKLSRTKVVDSGHLSFAGRGLKLNKASDADEIVAAIKQSKSLTALSLSGNTVGVEAAQAIAKALENHSNFQRALWSDIFTGRLKTEIPPSLNAFGAALILAGAQLVELDLSDNAFGPNGLAGLTDLLKSKSCFSLKELRLNNNGLGILGGRMLANSLLECYKNSCNAGSPLALRTFVSGRNRLENEGAKNLAEVFKAIGTLEELSMPQNGIQYPGIAALATALAVNKNLRILNLNDNTFTVKGATAVAAVLDKMPDLEVINFGDCLVRSEGASLLAEALSSNHVKLKHLILNGNEINSYAALKIIDSIENKTNLEKLDLDANQLGSDAVEMVKASMDSMNKQDALGSLSDDEGEEDDYKDDDAYDDIENEEDSEEEEDELTDDGEGEVVDDPNLEIKGKAIAPVKMVSAHDFLAFPSPTKLIQMGTHRAEDIIEELGEGITDIDQIVKVFLKVSSVVVLNDKETREAACSCSEELLKQAFNSCLANISSLLPNSLLVHLGLLKGEDKRYKPPGDISGPLLVLAHIVKQPYFPDFSRDILTSFVSRPSKLTETCHEAKEVFLQAACS